MHTAQTKKIVLFKQNLQVVEIFHYYMREKNLYQRSKTRILQALISETAVKTNFAATVEAVKN